MSRTTPTEVSSTFDTDLSDSQLQVWIDTASDIVDTVETQDSSLTDSRLTNIERLLAQGYAAIQDPRLSSTSRETASADYQRQDEYPNDYIWLAVSADPTGVVANSFKQTAGMEVPDLKGIDD